MPDDRALSRRLSYLLRHAPSSAGLVLDPGGRADVGDVLRALGVDRRRLQHVVATNDKQRFALSDDGRRIRASQGHSVPVELGYAPTTPPDVLFHGTAARSVPAVLREGLHRAGRHAVHLSADVATAARVGARRGDHAVLVVDAAAMHVDGHVFTRSANGVWLVDAVPARYLSTTSSSEASSSATKASRTSSGSTSSDR